MIKMNQTNDSTNITIEQNIFLTDISSNTIQTRIQASRTGELIAGIIVSKRQKKIFVL
jgi:hypothetical protein